MAFGKPVVPEEYSTQRGWLKGTRSNETASSVERTTSRQLTIRSEDVTPDASGCSTIITLRRLGIVAMTSLTVNDLSWNLPPYLYPSTAIRTTGSICAKRSVTAPAPKSGEHDDHTAPNALVARNATVASGEQGTNAATRSPRFTPMERRYAWSAATSRVRLSQLTSRSLPVSSRNKIAGCDGVALRRICSA